jgi:hypothetical protein
MKWLVAIGLLVSVSAQAQTTRFYAPDGNPRGYERWEQGGSRLVLRDNAGNPHGYWTQQGSEWQHRDNNGNLIGRAKTLPN